MCGSKSWFGRMVAAVTLAVGACGAFAGAREGTVNMNSAGAFEFPADVFPILPWGRGPDAKFAADPVRGIPSLAECGFTLAGFVSPELLPLCEEYGLKAIVHPGAAGIGKKEWKTLTPGEIDGRIRAMVAAVGDSPALIGYYLVDEPGASMFRGLGAAVVAVRKYAPGKLAYINLFPGYATIGAPDRSQLETDSFAEYLERYVAEVRPQFISYDDYMVQYSQDMRVGPRAATYYRDLLEVRRVAFAHGLTFWNICSSNQIRAFTTVPSPANLALQAFTTLAAGGRGLSWYTYDIGGYGYRPIDKAGRRTATWQYLQLINRQVRVIGSMMNRLTSTGVYFSRPAPLPNLPALPGRVLREVTSAATGVATDDREAPPPFMVGEFTDAKGRLYAMIVNLSLESSTLIHPAPRESGATLAWASPVDGSWTRLDPQAGLWLVAGQGTLFRVE